ncbi:hypothetical protein ES705_15633 [subsurface metagenome]
MNLSYYSTEFVEKISFPRLAGTLGEQKAQELIEDELKKLNLENVIKNSFTYSTFFMNVLLRVYDFIVGLMILIIILILLFDLYYFAMILAGCLFIISFFSREIRERLQFKVNKIGKKRTSYNYIVRQPAVEQNAAENRNIIIFAHYDSISHSLNPLFSGIIFFFSLVGGSLFSLHVIITLILFSLKILPLIDLPCFFYGFFLAGFYSIQLLNFRYNKSDGTADNATGIACSFYLLDYFSKNKLNNINLVVVFTGAEEMGDQGAYDFITKNYNKLDNKQSYFIIIDSVGANPDKNLYFYAQGLPKKRFSPVLESKIDQLIFDQESSKYQISAMYIPPLIHFSTDHAPLKHFGYEFMIFSSNAQIHSAKDNIQNYHPLMLENFNNFMRDLIIKMDNTYKK